MSTSSTDIVGAVLDWIKGHLKLVIAGVVVFMLIVAGAIFLSWQNKIHNEGYTKQRDVTTTYNNYQTALSNCLDKTNIASQVAVENIEQIKNALTAVVGARYEDASALSSDGPIVSALVEQYPQIDNTLWQQLMTTALGCRDEVVGMNEKLQYHASVLEKWINTGSWYDNPWRNNWPNDQLKVVSLSGTITGQEALEFIMTPLTTSEAKNALLTHEMPTQELFPGSGSSPSPTE